MKNDDSQSLLVDIKDLLERTNYRLESFFDFLASPKEQGTSKTYGTFSPFNGFVENITELNNISYRLLNIKEILQNQVETECKWEYLSIVISVESQNDRDKKINEMGSLGWEIVNVVPRDLKPLEINNQIPDRHYQLSSVLIFFKRRKISA